MGVLLQIVLLHVFLVYGVTVNAGPSHCGSNSTISKCANNSKICGEHHNVKFEFCKLECACKDGFYYDPNKNDCVLPADCSEDKHGLFHGIIEFFHPHRRCNHTNNEIYVRCSNCFTTCQTKVPNNLKPIPGCVCGKGFILDETNNECLLVTSSRDKCNIAVDEVIDKTKNFTYRPKPIGSALHLVPDAHLDDLITKVWGNRSANTSLNVAGATIGLETRIINVPIGASPQLNSTRLNETNTNTTTPTANSSMQLNETSTIVATTTVNSTKSINETNTTTSGSTDNSTTGLNATTATPNEIDNKTSTVITNTTTMKPDKSVSTENNSTTVQSSSTESTMNTKTLKDNKITSANSTNATTINPNGVDNKTSTVSTESNSATDQSPSTESAAIANITASVVNSSLAQTENLTNSDASTKSDKENASFKAAESTKAGEIENTGSVITSSSNGHKDLRLPIGLKSENTEEIADPQASTKRSKIDPYPIRPSTSPEQGENINDAKLSHASQDDNKSITDIENSVSYSTKDYSSRPLVDVTEGKEGTQPDIDEYIDEKAKAVKVEDTTKLSKVIRRKRFLFNGFRPNNPYQGMPVKDLFSSGLSFQVNKHIVRVHPLED